MNHNDETNGMNGFGETSEEREVRELLHEAGRREAIPSDAHARLESTARSAWGEMVAVETPGVRRLPPRTAALAAALVIAIVLGWIVVGNQGGVKVDQVATVLLEVGAEAVGSMQARGDATFGIAVGDGLPAGVRLVTSGGDGVAEGRLALRMRGGEAVRLDAGSTVWVVSSTRLELESGAVYVDTASAGSQPPLEIATQFGVVHHLGTQYEVRLEDSAAAQVRVREGAVSVRNNGDSWAAREGEQLTLLDDGSVTRGTVSADAWSWTLAAAPIVDIEGMNLDEYLDWVVRETGWRLEYENEGLASSAGQIVLHGTIEGLRPDESIDAIVVGSGLAYRVEDGVLWIGRP